MARKLFWAVVEFVTFAPSVLLCEYGWVRAARCRVLKHYGRAHGWHPQPSCYCRRCPPPWPG